MSIEEREGARKAGQNGIENKKKDSAQNAERKFWRRFHHLQSATCNHHNFAENRPRATSRIQISFLSHPPHPFSFLYFLIIDFFNKAVLAKYDDEAFFRTKTISVSGNITLIVMVQCGHKMTLLFPYCGRPLLSFPILRVITAAIALIWCMTYDR